MGRISAALMGFIAALSITLWAQTTPDHIYGTSGSDIGLWTPQQVVAAGGGGGGTSLPDASAAGQHLASTNTSGGVNWVTPPSGPRTFSTTAPLVPVANGATGTALTVSRGDHQHPPSPQIASALQSIAAVTDEVEAVTGPANTTADVGMVYTVTQCPQGTTGNCETAYRVPSGTSLPNAGSVGQHLASTNTSGGVNWVNPPIGLPSGAAADQILSQNADNTGAEWISSTTVVLEGSGITGTAQADRFVRANAQGNGIALTTAHDAVLAGLPALTGNGGDCVKVNSGATGLELDACGGGGGSVSWTEIYSGTPTAASVNITVAGITAVQRGAGYYRYFRITAYQTAQGTVSNTESSYQCIGRLPQMAPNEYNNRVQTTLVYSECQASDALQRLSISINQSNAVAVGIGNVADQYSWTVELTPDEIYGGGGAGGGGSSPPIPLPTPAGALQHLRVNQAGAAYELAAPPIGVPAFSNSNSLWQLQVNSAGDGLQWSNIADREITALDQRLSRIDVPSGASAPGVGQLYTVVSCAGSGANTACQGGWRAPADPPGFGHGWVKLYEGQSNNVGGGAQIDFDMTTDATEAVGFLAAMRDTAGMGVYRQFLFQVAWNIGTGDSEELVQAQAVLSGVPLEGSVAQVNQPVRYTGVLAGLGNVCPLALKATRTAVTVEGAGMCEVDWGNRGSNNVNLFWKLWGHR